MAPWGILYALDQTNQLLKAEKFLMLLLSFVSGGREGSSKRNFQTARILLESNTASHSLYYMVVSKVFSDFCSECILPCCPSFLFKSLFLSALLSRVHPGDFYRKLILQPKTCSDSGWGSLRRIILLRLESLYCFAPTPE